VALRLGAAMLALQAAIGALNDVVDAPRDAGHKPGKPIPAGLVSRGQGLAIAVGSALTGVVLSLPAGPGGVAVAVAILAVGALYDLWLKGTAWSWLPFALGIPLLPVFAWTGAGAPLPPAFGLLLPAAFLAGAGLAIGNGLVDVERDSAAGATSIAAHLGRPRAWLVMAVLYAAVAVTAAISELAGTMNGVTFAAVAAPALIIAAGAGLSASPSPARRERGWELQAVGVALLAAGWLATTLAR